MNIFGARVPNSIIRHPSGKHEDKERGETDSPIQVFILATAATNVGSRFEWTIQVSPADILCVT
jgi:hypothetical protein